MVTQTSYLSQISQIISMEKNCHVEKFQISVKNLNNLWSFIEIYAVFVLNLCGKKSLWRKNDKYEVYGNHDDPLDHLHHLDHDDHLDHDELMTIKFVRKLEV